MSTSAQINWYVLYTKPRNEKKVAERLTVAGYSVYCPLHKVRRPWSDREKENKNRLAMVFQENIEI